MKKQYKIYYITQFAFLFFCVQVFSQKAKGKILDDVSEPVMGATVTVNNKYFGMTNDEGNFSIDLPSSLQEYKIKVESIGYKLYKKTIINNHFLKIVLEKKTNQLDEVVLQFKTKAELLREQAYAVEVIETKVFKNLSVNANEILNKVSGVNIRQSGGLGEDAVLSVNGLSGSQIRLFIDGIPMEFFGSSLALNNFPANLIDQIEVYKGVVPIHLSADALGAAVNITTNNSQKSFLDASYSIGSFNTHVASVNGQYRDQENGFTARLKSFYNDSDNNYDVDVYLKNSDGTHDGFTTEVEHFHDAYNSKMAWGEVGFTKVDFADVLMLGVLYSDNYDEVQAPLNVLSDKSEPYGEIIEKEKKIITTINYAKNHFLHENLSFKTFLVGILSENYLRDLSSYEYNWLGKRTLRSDQDTGEIDERKSELTIDSQNILGNINMGYVFSDVSNLAFNYSLNFLDMKGKDDYNGENNTRFSNPITFNKQVVAVSYTHSFFEDQFKNSVFSKYYTYTESSTDTNYFGDELTPSSAYYEHFGYGFTSTCFLNDFQFKASFEHAVRFPDFIELYGDGLGVGENQSLVPEESNNYNLGVIYKTNFHNNSFMFSANGFIRDAENFILPRLVGRKVVNQNLRDVVSRGIDFSANYNYNQKINFAIAGTYTHKIDNDKTVAGGTSSTYRQRIPNDPYLYGNVSLSYTEQNLLEDDDNLSLTINESYIHDFYYRFANLGSQNKNIITSQLTTDLDLVYSSSKQRYNVSLGVVNLFDADTYDNLNQQNPGRWYNLKLRYFFN